MTPIEQIVQPKDKDLNTELFGDNDDRRNKVVNRNNQPRRNIVVQQSQPQQQQYQDTKYIKYEYQQEKEIVYDIQGMSHKWLMSTDGDVTSGWADFDILDSNMIGNEGGIEYHEEPIEYHDQECYSFYITRLIDFASKKAS